MTPPLDAALLRSLLFVPATRPDRFERAAAAGADAIIVDLEDAVPIEAKDDARAQAATWAATPGRAGVVRCLRVNSIKSAHGLRDLLALAAAPSRPPLLMLPKVESVGELDVVDGVLGGTADAPGVLALIETARGLAAAAAIGAHPRVGALVLGGADLAADLGAMFAWEPLLWARGQLVAAAATAGVAVIDMPWLDLEDHAGLVAEVGAARRLGFTGKLAIHPKHVPAINGTFTPGAAEIARARRIVDAADAAGGGVCVVEGRMVDAPVVRAARRTLSLTRD